MKKYYVLCLLLFGLSAFAFELSEPIENALKMKQIESVEQKEDSIKEVKNEVQKPQNDNEKLTKNEKTN